MGLTMNDLIGIQDHLRHEDEEMIVHHISGFEASYGIDLNENGVVESINMTMKDGDHLVQIFINHEEIILSRCED